MGIEQRRVGDDISGVAGISLTRQADKHVLDLALDGIENGGGRRSDWQNSPISRRLLSFWAGDVFALSRIFEQDGKQRRNKHKSFLA